MTLHHSNNKAAMESRLRGALWSFFSGDALAAPTHWYYGGFPQIQADYGRQGITDYTKPKLELRGSILNKSDINGGGRSAGSSSWKNVFGGNNIKKEITIIGDVINHGKKSYWDPHKSIHYHATLQKGENTLEAQLARVLMKSIVVNNGKFNANHFRQAYMDFMQTPGSHNDTYASTCHRMFFFNLIHKKLPPTQCPDNDGHNVDAIDGLILPTIVTLATAANPATANDFPTIESVAAECAAVTRQSTQLESASRVWSRFVTATLQQDNPEQVQKQLAQCSESWGLRHLPNATAQDQMTACYLSQAAPALLDMIAKYMPNKSSSNEDANNNPVWKALLANANVGGENVHRGSILGAVLGARAGYPQGLPTELVQGLYHKDELEKEIDDFVTAVMK